MPELSDALKRAVGEVPVFDPASLAQGVARRRRRRFESVLALSTVIVLVVGLVVWRSSSGNGVGVRTQTPGSAASTIPLATGAACPSATGPGASSAAARGSGGIQMVTNTRGWAVAGRKIVTTSDGTHFRLQYTANQPLGSVDAVNSRYVWAVGASSLFATIDGGRTWQALGEPPTPLTMVHFANPRRGFGVAADLLYMSTDGGLTWQQQSTPCPVDRVCFDTMLNGWIAGGNRAYVTVDGGGHWLKALQFDDPLNLWHAADLQCTPHNVAWAYFTEDGGAGSHSGYAAFHYVPDGACSLVIKENYIGAPPGPAPEGPGGYPGPMSVIDDHTAAFVGDTPPMDNKRMAITIISDDGRRVPAARSIVTDSPFLSAVSLSFRTADLGWLLYGGSRILVTHDGGATWKRVL